MADSIAASIIPAPKKIILYAHRFAVKIKTNPQQEYKVNSKRNQGWNRHSKLLL